MSDSKQPLDPAPDPAPNTAANTADSAETRSLKLEVARLNELLSLQGNDGDTLTISQVQFKSFINDASQRYDKLAEELIAKETEVERLKSDLAKANTTHIASQVPPSHAGMMSRARNEYEKIIRELDDYKKKAEAYKTEAETYKKKYEEASRVQQPNYVSEDISAKFRELASRILLFCRHLLQPDTSIATEGEERRDYSNVSRNWRQHMTDHERAPFFLSALIWRHLFLEVLLLGPGVWGAEAQNNTTSFYNWLKGQSGMNKEIMGLIQNRVDSRLDQSLTDSPEFVSRVSTALWVKLYAHIPLNYFDLNVEKVRTMVRDACKLSIMADSCAVNMVYPQRAFDPSFTLPFNESEMQSVKTTRSDGKVDLCVTPALWNHHSCLLKAFVVT